MYPISVKKNDYLKNRKNNCIETPAWIAQAIYDIVGKFYYDTVFDVGCADGNLSKPHKDYARCIGIDIKDRKYHSEFIQMDFIKNSSKLHYLPNDKHIILINPPFNDSTGEYKKKLLPEVFLKKIFEVWGYKAKVVLFTPMGFLFNIRGNTSTGGSERYRWLLRMQNKGCTITSRAVIPLDAFKGVLFHSEILFWNMKGLKPVYILDKNA